MRGAAAKTRQRSQSPTHYDLGLERDFNLPVKTMHIFPYWPGELAQMVERLLSIGRGPIFELPHAREKEEKDAENGRTR